MSKKRMPKLSDANFEIMKLVWEKGEVTINEVLDAVNTKRKEKIKRASIQVQMRRLEQYGWLKHRKVDRTFYYTARENRDTATRHILDDVKDRVFGGSNRAFVHSLFENLNIPPGELERIARLLDEAGKG